MPTGSVKWLKNQYGFVAADDGSEDMFLHVRQLQRAGFDHLLPGQKISYEVDRHPVTGRTSASNVAVLNPILNKPMQRRTDDDEHRALAEQTFLRQ